LFDPSVKATSMVVEPIFENVGVLGAFGLEERLMNTVNDVGPPKPLVPEFPMLNVTF
jgi:hypothetical protein